MIVSTTDPLATAAEYRYGFQGQEKDNEIKGGDGKSINYTYRMHDPRVGRFFATDPLESKYVYLSPYHFSHNSPIFTKELEGMEGEYYVLDLRKQEPKLEYNKPVDYWLIPNSIETDYIVVEVPGNNDTYISYTFTAVGANGLYSNGETGRGNYLLDFKKFKEDPLGAIYSGDFVTDQKILSDAAKDVVFMAVLASAAKGMKVKVPDKGSPPITRASSTNGWKVGQPINNLTDKGKIPSWSTIRARHWKNRAANVKEGEFTSENLERMKKGRAPQRYNEETGKMESMELHHKPPQRDGGLFDFEEVWPDQHAAQDPYRHTGTNKKKE